RARRALDRRGLRSNGRVLSRRPARGGGRGDGERTAGTVGYPVREAVAARGLAGCADVLPAVSGRPLLPGGVHAPGGARAPRDHPRRDGRWPPPRPRAPHGARRAIGDVPNRVGEVGSPRPRRLRAPRRPRPASIERGRRALGSLGLRPRPGAGPPTKTPAEDGLEGVVEAAEPGEVLEGGEPAR